MRRIIVLAIIALAMFLPLGVDACDGRCGEVQSWENRPTADSPEETPGTPEFVTGPVTGKGHPFVGISDWDTGYCPNQNPYGGSGWDGRLVWPVSNPVVEAFGLFSATHSGIDIEVPLNTPVYAAEDGIVVYSGWSTYGFGNLVVIAHGNTWQTLYAHLSTTAVSCGQAVEPGDLLGYSGSTGQSTRPHLHFETRKYIDGFPQSYNPLLYLDGSLPII